MCNILSKKVINKLHKYKTVKMTVPTAKKMDRLPDSAWCGMVKEDSLHFIEVQGTKQNTEWYSPGVGNWCVPTADLTLLKKCYALQDWTLIDTAWQGSLFKCTRRLIFCAKGSPCYRYVGLLHFKESVVLVWPVTLSNSQDKDTTGCARSGFDLPCAHHCVQFAEA